MYSILSVNLILRFSSKKASKKYNNGKIDPSIHLGVWTVDPLDGGILDHLYPDIKLSNDEALEQISSKIKNLINITVRDMNFKSEWSLSPLTIDNYHHYLYGFFLDRWRVISIHLPIEYSLWLIDIKSDLLIFESYISTKVTFFPLNQWEEHILIPLYEEFIKEKEQFAKKE